MIQEIKGDLIQLAKKAEFDVIAHGVNCICKQKSGIAKQMVSAFGTNSPLLYPGEDISKAGDINKLGNIESHLFYVDGEAAWTSRLGTSPIIGDDTAQASILYVVNAYTQYAIKSKDNPTPIDYHALDLCLQKISRIFDGLHIGLPLIGCGLAGGDWGVVMPMIERRLKNCEVTIVHYDN